MTVIFLALSSASILLATFGDYDGEWYQKVAAVMTGVLFWLFLILGYISFFRLSRSRKAFEAKHPDAVKRKSRKPGVIVFFSNRYAATADIVMVISLIIFLLSLFVPFLGTLKLLWLAVLIFAAQMHGILNGINYKYIMYIQQNKRSKTRNTRNNGANTNV